MGLMEKALSYKNKINNRGKKSIMDRITGPADLKNGEGDSGTAEILNKIPEEDVVYLAREDLVAVDMDTMHETEPESSETADQPDTKDRGERKPKFSIENDGTHEVKRPADGMASGWDESGVLLDNMALYALSRDILNASSADELFDVILFSVMGQIGVSSSSIMIPCWDNMDEWEIVKSQGVAINRDEVEFKPNAGILKQVISRKETVDIEDFKDDGALGDDYYSYISIDARLLVPIMYNENVLGVIVLGNKLDSKDYTGEEKGFFSVIAEYSAFSYRAILLKELNDTGVGPGSHIAALDGIRSKLSAESHIGKIRGIIQNEFNEFGILGYAIFIKDEGGRSYTVFATEKEDRLKLAQLQFRIHSHSGFIQEVANAESPIIYNDLNRSKPLHEILSEQQVAGMSMLDIFTFKLGGDLLGFIMVYDIADFAHLDSVHARMLKFTEFIFPYMAITRDIEYRQGGYVDTIENTYNRIDEEIKNARDLNIPISLVLLSIKNYKRYHALFGQEKARSMFDHFEKFIRSRISDRDFSVRFDRHKILIVLPGKNKKYAVPLAHTLCNEMTHAFSTREVQLLVTFLTSEYPVDGTDAYTLVDVVN